MRHAALRHGEGLVLLRPDLPDELHGTHVGHGWVYVAVGDPDAHFERAKAAGAEVLGEPHDAMGGMRGYSARDLEGNPSTDLVTVRDAVPVTEVREVLRPLPRQLCAAARLTHKELAERPGISARSAVECGHRT